MSSLRFWSGLLAGIILCSAVSCKEFPDRWYQVSTIGALQEGVFDGALTCGQLKREAYFGLGTFDKLDGEMVVLDGVVYQCRADGSVRVAPDDLTTPFAVVARPKGNVFIFNEDHRSYEVEIKNVKDISTLADFSKAMDAQLESPNLFYVLYASGHIKHLKLRTVPAQSQPYPKLSEATQHQLVTELHAIDGTLVALRTPAYAKGLNVPGWHVHFLSNDHKKGGHVLDVSFAELTVHYSGIHNFTMVLPNTPGFLKANLSQDTSKEVEKAEK